MSPRAYDASGRRRAADATRRKILEAARTLVGGRGDLRDFSMDLVADRADVSRMTVYHQFHSRAGLLEALADHLAERGGLRRLREVFVEVDPEVALRSFVETFVEFWASDRETIRRLRAMAVVFPLTDRSPRQRDEWRRDGAARIVARLRPAGPHSTDRNERSAVDLLTALTSFEMYDLLAAEGRSARAVATLVYETARQALGRPERRSRRTARRARRSG